MKPHTISLIIAIAIIITTGIFLHKINKPKNSQKVISEETKISPQNTISKKISWEQNKYFKVSDIDLPKDFHRPENSPDSFEYFLSNLPLVTNRNKVLLYNRREKSNQEAHFAIINLPIQELDLEQCADAIIRLRAEYLFSKNKIDEIHFNFTNGFNASYSKMRAGYRLKATNNQFIWQKETAPDTSKSTFNKYLKLIFTYSGTLSLSRELKSANLEDIKIGDIFIKGGSPGHAVIVVDLATNPSTKEKLFLLAQSYMPAQEIHILKNPNNPELSPWYSLKESQQSQKLDTPEWLFDPINLKTF